MNVKLQFHRWALPQAAYFKALETPGFSIIVTDRNSVLPSINCRCCFPGAMRRFKRVMDLVRVQVPADLYVPHSRPAGNFFLIFRSVCIYCDVQMLYYVIKAAPSLLS